MLLRACKETHNALPLFSSPPWTWALQPDGVLLCIDHDALGFAATVEEDPRVRFAAILHGAARYPELQRLVPPCPIGVSACDRCLGTGRLGVEAETSQCARCDGMGWAALGTAAPA